MIWLIKFALPETMWSNHEQVEDSLPTIGGPNQCLLQKAWMICD